MPSSTQDDLSWSELHRVRRAIVVVDVVESVRLMQADEAGTIERWRRLVHGVRAEVLPRFGGRMVKSLGDGMLLEFASALAAMSCALAIQAAARPVNEGKPADERLELRIGAHVADVVVDADDVYGAGVNLAARVAGLAQAGEVVVTDQLRDELGPGFDLHIQDLGHCYLKNLAQPVRAFRVAAADPGQRSWRPARHESMQPTIAVLPLSCMDDSPQTRVRLDLVASELIAALSLSGHWHVVSRLSSESLKGRPGSEQELAGFVGADYVIAGQGGESGGALHAQVVVSRAESGQVLWNERLSTPSGGKLEDDTQVAMRIAAAASSVILGQELRRGAHSSLPNLEAYAVLFQSISLMHRSSQEAVDQATRGLEYLIDRNPRAPEPRAWIAKCHVLRVAHGKHSNALEESARARDHVRRALDLQPEHALAWAVDGLVQMFINRDLEGAAASYALAIRANPNESLAWLFQSSIHAHRAQGQAALACVERAARLSPLDPLDHYFNGFTAWACIAAGDYARAEQHALRAMQSDCTHRPTFLTLAQAQALLGKHDLARKTAQRLVELIPGFTVSRYLAGFPGGETDFARMLGHTLRDIGVPA